MKILILKPSSLGDVVHAMPVVRLLRQRFPQAEIHWWILRGLMPLLQGDRDVNRLIPFDRKRWGNPSGFGSVVSCIREMRAERYDWVIDLQSLARSGVIAWLANGELTIGLDDAREGATALYDLRVPRPSFNTHAVDWYLEVLRHLQVPVHSNFEWMPRNEEAAVIVDSVWPRDGRRWIALQPGARWWNKRWPAERFGELARRLLALDDSLGVAVLGDTGDRPLAEQITAIAGPRCLDLTGQLSLPGMVEWIRRCDVLVTNDTGPMHVAVALGVPVVALFGPTEPTRTGPYRQLDSVLRVDLECAPCLKASCRNPEKLACLNRLPVDAVVSRVVSLLASKRPTH